MAKSKKDKTIILSDEQYEWLRTVGQEQADGKTVRVSETVLGVRAKKED